MTRRCCRKSFIIDCRWTEGPGLLAHWIVRKYTDHLPRYHLERIYGRKSVYLPCSTLCDWLAACAALLWNVYELRMGEVLDVAGLHTDDTTVKMEEPQNRVS